MGGAIECRFSAPSEPSEHAIGGSSGDNPVDRRCLIPGDLSEKNGFGCHLRTEAANPTLSIPYSLRMRQENERERGAS